MKDKYETNVMIKPPIPSNESQRLQTLRDLNLLDTAPEERFDRVTRLAKQDQRFCDSPLVCGSPNIRFYAGYPLAAPDGSRIGTLCIIDDKPRDISNEQLQLLRELGRMVEEDLIAANDCTNDVVTGLSNRNGFIAIANHLLPLCRRKKQPSTVRSLRGIDSTPTSANAIAPPAANTR